MPKREHRSNAEWQDIIERQEQSGLTGVAFCLQEAYTQDILSPAQAAETKRSGGEAESVYPDPTKASTGNADPGWGCIAIPG